MGRPAMSMRDHFVVGVIVVAACTAIAIPVGIASAETVEGGVWGGVMFGVFCGGFSAFGASFATIGRYGVRED